MEKIGGCYASVYESKFESRYRTYPPDSVFVMDRGEFIHRRTTNALGFADQNWDTAKTANEIRILVLGDSFTEGVGAEQDESYPAVLQRLLQQGDSVHSYRVMNAGIQGSDPCVNAVNFKERLQVFRPDLVIQTLSSNDLLTDIAVKGGLERWQPDSTIRFRPGPVSEPLFAMSYVYRLLTKSIWAWNELLLPEPMPQLRLKEIQHSAADCMALSCDLLAGDNCSLLVLLLPNSTEIFNNKYQTDPGAVMSFSAGSLISTRLNLLPAYRSFFTSRMDIPVNAVGSNAALLKVMADYYWQQDGHHNKKGYELMASLIYPEVKKCLRQKVDK